ncbi:hypothetical protein P344_06905 [Spiroplasma mirum ATCC 29335]|uniref:Uncharacterized protein n=1 Tax=Spiroplasma mirum ATCC 29335 TaxID=838561 RepID=W0GMX4_9MOLU|nr:MULTISPECIES: hypothetical protein [Spiroplasma]AHF61527.1 hypothetical protein SMM_1160 [Spiroplasma mirum ATCC 29335]AHI58679.1 hypothetical protein P344_06905 [Spiroplasma mirum ATCC 29335]AKM53566.1 hypothetical protein SATRI_v1c12310 [Spiroplasma atrichopogonis]
MNKFKISVFSFTIIFVFVTLIFSIITFATTNNAILKDTSWNNSQWIKNYFDDNHHINWSHSEPLFLLLIFLFGLLILLSYLTYGIVSYFNNDSLIEYLPIAIGGTVLMSIVFSLITVNFAGLFEYSSYLKGAPLGDNNPWKFNYTLSSFVGIKAGVNEVIAITFSGLSFTGTVGYAIFSYFYF